MNISEIIIVSATVFFTMALSMVVFLAIYMLLRKIIELSKKRKKRAERDQGYFLWFNNFFI